jgi:hypothetical protein
VTGLDSIPFCGGGEDAGRRKEKGGRRKEEGGRRKEEGGKRTVL